MKSVAIRYDQKGSELRDAGDVDGAIRYYEKAIRHAPQWSVPWYNLGLVYKYERQWQESFRCNAEAVELDPSDEAAIWNMGVAATALGWWPEARSAWRQFGIRISEGT
jgi:tetratricopeptide (TPR) repeat protein